jgi:hypothetical protein
MAGAAVQGLTAVKVGLEAFQKALPSIPMGSELHGAVLKAISDIAKHMEGGGDQAAQIQQLVAMARDAHANPAQAAQMRALMPGGGGAQAPPMMPGGGGAPPPPPGM